MVCSKCGSSNTAIRLDKRNVAEYYCKDCGAGLGKVSSAALVGMLDRLIEENQKPVDMPKEKQPCKYCTEKYVMLRGNLQTRVVQVPIEAVYCPMCGRKLSIHDRDY